MIDLLLEEQIEIIYGKYQIMMTLGIGSNVFQKRKREGMKFSLASK
jgi:hypothetical protein